MAISVNLSKIRAIGAWQETKGAVMKDGRLVRTEGRAAVTPKMVAEARKLGIKMNLGAGIGDLSGFSDAQYEAAGARLFPHTVKGISDLMAASQFMVRVKELQHNALIGGEYADEFRMLADANKREAKMVMLYMHIGSEKLLAERFAGTGALSIAYETVKESDRSVPMLDCMSRLTGDAIVKILCKANWHTGGPSSLVSGYYRDQERRRVLMIGGGNVGASASVFLLGANAEVRILDLYPDNPLKHFARMAANRFPSWFRRDHFGEIDVRKLTEAEVEEGLRWANGSHIITSNKSLDRPGSPADKVITDRHFSMLRFGTCIWDVSIDQGGATTKSHPTEHGEKTEAYIVGPDCYVYPDGEYDHPGVRMYCVDHIPGAFPETATLALTGATAPYIFDIATLGLADAIDKRPSLLGGINAAAGRLTLQSVTDKFGLGGLFTPVSELQLVQN